MFERPTRLRGEVVSRCENRQRFVSRYVLEASEPRKTELDKLFASL
jgi:hypothetical protein